ncbi:hypothetical protein CDAR_554451 [Caerostris darwini]|uniref:Uncharacterized protein n=1 Tax=Caerostris darwini TaxID=1538125 RepID=A0AAV4SQ39_9ARAC|nr:hypothetical protein CDAR_554451 [Caerostris darwini]
MICNSKRSISINGWLILTKLVTFLLHLPIYIQSKTLVQHIPVPPLEDATFFVWQTLVALQLFETASEEGRKSVSGILPALIDEAM